MSGLSDSFLCVISSIETFTLQSKIIPKRFRDSRAHGQMELRCEYHVTFLAEFCSGEYKMTNSDLTAI